MDALYVERAHEHDRIPQQSPLASIFLSHAAPSVAERSLAIADLEAKLRHIIEKAREAWPVIKLSNEDFIAFLGHCVSGDAAASLETLRVGDLYLVCAYGHGLPAAYEALERHHMVRVRAALGRLGVPSTQIADIQQELRGRLIEMQHPGHGRKPYEGRGDLGAWLCVSAIREARLQRTRRARELPIEAFGLSCPMSNDQEPETALLEQTCKPQLAQALRDAMTMLCTKERALLRYHFIDHLSIDRIGLLYGVHRATAARWINQARETLCARTLELLRQRIALSEESFNRMITLLESQLHTEIHALVMPF
jgi:RNA polymerase sigma-70 factor (ECF subfamily)